MKKNIYTICAFLVLALFFLNPAKSFSAARDCDGNAVIYCGTLTKQELKSKLLNGTGKQYQSAKELQSLFSKFGITLKDIDNSNLKDGKVTKDGKVYVGNTVYATRVKSMGRHKTAHSVQVSGVPYPLYLRPTSDSFLASSLDAFVYLNQDKSMAFAIIKSCGNIVPGVGIKQTSTPQAISLKIQKFEDRNENGRKDFGEPFLANWNFRVVGPGFDQIVSSDIEGKLTLANLIPGTYTVTEIVQNGWENTTGQSLTKNISTNNSPQTFVFGNKKITPSATTPSEPPLPGGDTTKYPTQLPVSGPAETAVGVSALALSGALLFWLDSKKKFRLATSKKYHKK